MRGHDVTALTARELEQARRELAASLALTRPSSPPWCVAPGRDRCRASRAGRAGHLAALNARRPPLHRQSLAG